MDEVIKEEVKEEKKDEAPLSRRDAILKGMEGLDKEKKEEVKEDPKDEEEIEEKDEVEVPDPDETRRALDLLRTLNDPDKGPQLLKILAQTAGLTKESTSEEKKVIIKSVKEVVKEALGPDYQFLADRLGNALTGLIPETKGLEDRLNRLETENVNSKKEALANEIDSALSNCFGQFEKVDPKVQTRFNELIDEMPPVPGKTKPDVYFKRIIKLAQEETGITLKLKSNSSNKDELTQGMKDRITRNKNDASSKLASKEASTEVTKTFDAASQPKSRREAIEMAVKKTEDAMAGKK